MKSSRHHIVPRSRGGKSNKYNIILRDQKQHEAYHALFGNSLPEEAVMIIVKKWFYTEPTTRDRKLHALTMELAKLCSDYIEKQKRAGLLAGGGV